MWRISFVNRSKVNIFSFGVSHQTANVEVRERFAIPDSALAQAVGGRAIRFDDWEQEFRDLDILVSSTAAPHAVVTKAKIEGILRMRRDRPLFVIDLAIPRDVEPTVRELDDVYVYDLDSLQTIADRTLSKREEEIEACDSLIEKHVCDFQVWLDRASERVIPNRGDRAPANVKPIGLESTLL